MASTPDPASGLSSDLPDELQLVIEPHVKYIESLNTKENEIEYWLSEHLRLSGFYWGLNSLHLMGRADGLPRKATIDFVMSCQHRSGGFGAAPKHDPHLLYTCSAIQILALVDGLDALDKQSPKKEGVGRWIASQQNKHNGTFSGDEWGEEDTRFIFNALLSLSLLRLLDLVDVKKAVDYVVSCQNFDGGYGVSPGAESHSGQVYTCVGTLAIAKRLDLVDITRLGQWLSERQVDAGGLNGRPEKLEDSCYSWWVGSSLAMIGKLHYIDRRKLSQFILRCQDVEKGGFADRPGDVTDVFHTNFGLAGLSLLEYPGLEEIDPVYCLPVNVVQRVLGNTESKAIEPEVMELEAMELETTESKAVEPEAVEPKATESNATEPKAMELETMESKAVEPEAVEPKATESNAIEPKATESEATEPEVIGSNAMESEAIESNATESEAMESEAVKSKAMESEAIESEAMESEAMDEALP